MVTLSLKTIEKLRSANPIKTELTDNRRVGAVCEKHPEEGGVRYKSDNGCVGCKRDAFQRYKKGPKREAYLKRMRESKAVKHAALKSLVITAYGGKCERCPESDIDVLNIDHTDGNGAMHRKSLNQNVEMKNNWTRPSGTAKVYRFLRDNNFPSGFRVLCFNCNYKAYLVYMRANKSI